MLIGGLEGVLIHPLDAKPMGQIERSTDTTVNALIKCIFSDSILGNTQRKVPALKVQNGNFAMSNDYAKKFFGITDEDLKMAKVFNN